jgi:DNA-binding response OmpR family regulator
MTTTTLEAVSPRVRETQRRPRALVVDTNAENGRYLLQNLTADQMDVVIATTGDEAIDALERFRPDIVLVAEELSDMSGLELITHVRSGGPGTRWDADTALIVLSSRDDTDSVVRSLQRGADDYVVMPYRYQELLTRMVAILRRSHGNIFADRLHVGSLMLDCKGLTAWHGDVPVHLCAKEFSLLVALARDPVRTVPKTELLQSVWGFSPYAQRTRTLDTHASRLRRKLESAGVGGMVHNVWGFGYRLLPLER